MSHDLTLTPGPSVRWWTVLFAALAALAAWTALTHPRQAVAVAAQPAAPAVAVPAADPGAVFIGVAPKAAEAAEEPAPTF
jgi:hypothetical protein